jgi:hypothetical protein
MSEHNKKTSSKGDLEATNENLLKIEDKQNLQQLIIQLTEQRVENKFSDKSLDNQLDKIKLLSGVEISIKEIEGVIAANLETYPSKFHQEYFIEMYRINNWKDKNPKDYFKPLIVGKYINETIYSRFNKDVLPTLQQLNPYVGFSIRMHKHYQFLNEAGIAQLENFISDAIRIMKTCDTQYEFRVKLFNEFAVPYQIQLFQ